MSDDQQPTDDEREQLATVEQAALAAYDTGRAERGKPIRDALTAGITANQHNGQEQNR